ncbi:YceI family protein [Aliidiomarina celeris]|uniref:YceI family protein n=1 Tax=Aliidiomarina celeris TaxID=2249428 RepID=UPI000DE960F2|nr:YceI family protein [Aliidiomarina celeris]
MNFTKSLSAVALAASLTSVALLPQAQAADYVIDTDGAHASINFTISHLGYSYVVGRFNEFTGTFSYDANNPSSNKIEVTVDTASIDSNHTDRDNHVRSSDYLDVNKFPEASFVSTRYQDNGDGTGVMYGNLTLFGSTNEIAINVTVVGEGEDPWGGYRAGFAGTAELNLPDFGMNFNLGPAAETVYMDLHVEGIRQ